MTETPYSLEAEQALLGAMVIDPAIIPEIRLAPGEFYKPANVKIFETIRAMDNAGEAVDIVTVVDKLKSGGDLPRVGGQEYVAKLAAQAFATVNFKFHEGIVREKAQRRLIFNICQSVMTDIADIPLSEAQQRLYIDLDHGDVQHRHIKEVTMTVAEQTEALYRLKKDGMTDAISGVPTGFSRLDGVTDGCQPGELIIIGGDTGMGKSALVGQITRHAGKTVPVHVNNLEMTAEGNVGRMVADHSNIPAWRIRKAWMESQDQWGKFDTSLGELGQLKITFDDTSTTLSEIIQSIIKAVKAGAGLCVVDYLQMIDNPLPGRTDEQEIAGIAKAMKLTAKKYKIPIILITSINRALAGRQNKRPMKSDLRGSGQIEFAADIIMLVYREDAYRVHKAEHDGRAELIIAKGRNIGESVINLRWNDEQARFEEGYE